MKEDKEADTGIVKTSVDSDQEPASSSQSSSTDERMRASSVPASSKIKPTKRNFRWLVAAAVLLVIGASVFVYALWYQNPERVVGEAMLGLLSADNISTSTSIVSGSEIAPGLVNIKLKKVDITSGFSKTAATGEAEVMLTLDMDGREYRFGAKGRLIEDKAFYFQLIDIQQVLSRAIADFGDQRAISSRVESDLGELQNRWVKVPLDDRSDRSQSLSCIIDTTKRLAADQQYIDHLKRMYNEHKFITVTDSIGSRDGNLGYKLGFDKKQFKNFLAANRSVEAMKQYEKCPGYEQPAVEPFEEEADSDDAVVDVVVWVSRFGHQLQQIDYKIKPKGQTSQQLVFDGSTQLRYDPVNIASPGQTINVEEWLSKAEKMFQDAIARSNRQVSFPSTNTVEFQVKT